jgi:hypothetical protein
MRLTQPVLLQSLKDEFQLPFKVSDVPAPVGDLVDNGNDDEPTLSGTDHVSEWCWQVTS